MTADCPFHHLRHGNELVAFRLIARDQAVGRRDCIRTVRAEGPMSAIVQQDHIPASNLASYLSLDVLDGWRVPVVTGHIPHDWFQSHVPRDPQHGRAPTSKRWPKQVGV